MPDHALLLDFYYKMLLSRKYEERANTLFKAKAFDEKPLSGIGQEAVGVGAAICLEPRDFVAPSLRSKAVFFIRGVTPQDCFLQLFRRRESLSRGLWTAHHMGDMRRGVILSSALVASVLPVAAGVAMASQLQKTGAVTMAFFGDGACSRADVHTTLNLAAVRALPMVFICENNLYALSTPIQEQMKNTNIADRAAGYGMPGKTVDGQDVCAVYEAAKEAILRARNGEGPSLIVCETYRYRGHTETHAPIDNRPEDEYQRWLERDPIALMRSRLLSSGEAEPTTLLEMEARVDAEIEQAVRYAQQADDADASALKRLVYAD